MNLVFVSQNINILRQIVLILVLFPVIIVVENILIVFARPVFLPRRMAAKNIIRLHVVLFVKWLTQITAETEIVFLLLMAVLKTGKIVPQNVKLHIMTTVEIARRLLASLAALLPLLIVNPNVKNAKLITVTIERINLANMVVKLIGVTALLNVRLVILTIVEIEQLL